MGRPSGAGCGRDGERRAAMIINVGNESGAGGICTGDAFLIYKTLPSCQHLPQWRSKVPE
jgi:hypothetical protein